MLTIISPAKKLLSIDTPYAGNTSTLKFKNKTEELIKLMQTMTISDIRQMMHLSEPLAKLNYQRYQQYYFDNTPATACYPALFYFQGDVYQGMDAQSFPDQSVDFANNHLAILSGLYGLLSPLDVIQAYRLEMGTKLANSCGKNLYDFWQQTISTEINKQLAIHKNPVLINLASNEYFKAVDKSMINYPVVTINFKENRNGQLKTIGIHAKKARGLMARYIMVNEINTLEKIQYFNENEYYYCPQTSHSSEYNFIREHD